MHWGPVRSWPAAFLAWGAGAALAACTVREAAPPGFPADDLGRAVTLARPAQRIVSLSPSTTELLFDLGAGARVVGRTRWCDFPPEAAQVPSVGDGLDPNLELVLSRTPDLVVFYASAANQSAIARLDRLGVATASVRLDRLEDLPRVARLLGRLTGAEPRAESLAVALTAQLDSARGAGGLGGSGGSAGSTKSVPSGVSGLSAPRVAVIAWDNPPIVIGRGSFLSQLIELAGGRNVFDDIAAPSAQTGIEAIASRDPDVLLLLGDSAPAFARRPEWQSVGAVRRRSFLPVRGSEFERPTTRWLGAVRALRAELERRRSP